MRSLHRRFSEVRNFTPDRSIPTIRRWTGLVLLSFAATVLARVGLRGQQDGQQQWRFSVNGYVTLSSPAFSPDGATVYVGVETSTGGRVIAAAARDGGSRWGINGRVLKDPVESSPAVASDGTIYIGDRAGRLYALNPANGSSFWELPLRGFISSSPTIGVDGTIYVGAGDGRLYAVSRLGSELWSVQTDDLIFSSPAIGADGTIYFGSFDRHLYAVTPDGQVKWKFATGGAIFSSPAIGADGTIYVGSGDQRLYAVSPDGTARWNYFTEGPVDASPSLGADGTIYFASARNFYALWPGDVADRLRWKTFISSGTISSAAIRGDGTIIFGADDGKVRALNPDGSVKWDPPFDTKGGPDDLIESSPVVGPDGSIFVGSSDGALYKINGNGSPLSAYSNWPAFRRDTRHTARAIATSSDGRLVNISTRAQAGPGRYLIAGFFVQGVRERAYLIRAVGPGLQALNVAGYLPDPRLQVFSRQVPFRANDNWLPSDETNNLSLAETAKAVQAFGLQPGSADAAILPAVPPGEYTAQVNSADGRPGVGLVEIYDGLAGDETARLLNLSTRAFVGTGENILIAGFVVGGTGSMRLLLRGIGPGLSQFGVSDVLAQPRLAIFRGGTAISSNTGWTTNGFKHDLMVAGAAVSPFPLVEGRADSAMIFNAVPGAYTLQIAGVGDTTGEAMVEIYVLP